MTLVTLKQPVAFRVCRRLPPSRKSAQLGIFARNKLVVPRSL
jgi:hypothetical protein